MHPSQQYRAPNLTEIEWAYLAGIIDGEGTIRISRGSRKLPDALGWSRRYAGNIRITSTSDILQQWISKRVGDHWSNYSPKPPSISVLPIRVWYASGFRCVGLIERLLPYLTIKRARAIKVLELYSTGEWKYGGARKMRTSCAEMSRRELLYQAQGRLKRSNAPSK